MKTRMQLAMMMAAGLMGTSPIDERGISNKEVGEIELYKMHNHYRGETLNKGNRTNAAAQKRIAQKRKNIRARSSKRKAA